MTVYNTLLDKIQRKEAVIGIVGLGYVGLPLAIEFAEAGFRVIGVDVTQDKVDKINAGVSYIGDIPTPQIEAVVKSGKLKATSNYADLSEVDAISICVPTPLRKTKDPDMSYVINAIDSIAPLTHEGLLVILESTTYPGTTQEIIVPRLVNNGFVVGENVFVAFSPERIDPGNQTYMVRNTPKVIGGITANCTEIAQTLYSNIVDKVVPVSSPTTAEMVKLLENTFRAVNIGLVNEVALMCDRLGINVWEVINAAATKPFGFMPFYPGPGLGGHCIPVDPHYLSWKLKTLNYNARFIELASEINASMPLYVVDKAVDALNDECKSVRGSNILLWGVAYKRDIDDVRESPALDIMGLLMNKGANVQYYDPYVAQVRLGEDMILKGEADFQQAIQQADLVVVVTDHSVSDWQYLLDNSPVIVDTRNVLSKYSGKARVVTL